MRRSQLDSSNGQDGVFLGAHCVSDGKRVTSYKDGEKVWACNAVYAAAHFDFASIPSDCT
ncbi:MULTISPECIES: hypothetical protein [Cupriavidus]|uniref:Uncharacterized protein n=1 Tax=Cupriavidus alkaliphilus TaxID=942866 RepID=A0A7W4YU79_9BURK|nr:MULTISPECIES: hypothetical protein [Cupriavidus]MBB3009946.1 hypothetical protein [Cupriavidus alkaliphilus]GLC96659.1 hypothetical protein Tamer19_60680 [Cupriavidus sp. TA19]